MNKFQETVIETFSKPSFMQAVKESNLSETYMSKASELYLGLLNITTKMEDIEDKSNEVFCQLETASKRTKYLNEELQKIHIDSANSVVKKIISLLDEQYSFEESKLGVFGQDSSIGKCAQARMHLIEILKLKIKE